MECVDFLFVQGYVVALKVLFCEVEILNKSYFHINFYLILNTMNVDS